MKAKHYDIHDNRNGTNSREGFRHFEGIFKKRKGRDGKVTAFIKNLFGSLLLADDRHGAAVLCPCRLIMTKHGGTFFAIADGLDAVLADAGSDQVILG